MISLHRTSANRLLIATVLLSCAAICSACRDGGGADTLNPSTETDTVFAVISCDSKNADGSCNKWSCREDELGNCQTFAETCINKDHHYSGTAKEGTCSRIL